jgi:outer membrane receptor protein involved in Fe transport
MTLKTNQLRDAITFALAVGATAVAGTGIAFAQDATTPAPATTTTTTTTAPNQQAANLDRIEVTGSRIRRVDAENASPVVTIDRAAIEKTGKLTLGDLVQELPALAGAPTNPQVNNGGGTGASTIDLRGFGSARTLILVDGHRVMGSGINIGTDVNAIPASAVERIEVLTVGASSVYGSDAVAGVVNFIMRKDFEGLEASVDYGISDRSDGERQGGSLTFGQVGDKGNIIAGVNYNKFKQISSANRDFAKDATYLYYGSVFTSGSSRTPNGRIFLPAGNSFGCGSVTRLPGASGSSQSDYRCYNGQTDAFNYQRTNLILTPQERTNAFVMANYQMSDDVSAFLEVFHNKTSSGFAIAALPFDANSDKVNISANSYYNPFGVTFGPATGQNFLTRFTSLGQRAANYATTTDQVFAGLSGFLGDTWKWDAALNYGHGTLLQQTNGYVYYQGLRDALGPSFLDTDGVVKCGSAGNVIANCTPLNIFNIQDPQTIATLQQYAVTPTYRTTQIEKGFEANASGELFNLPAGAVQLAVGSAWRREFLQSQVDYVALATADGSCFISQEACGSPVQGSYSVGELYGELFVPVLKDVPFAKALNVTFGSRYSNYSNFGNTVNNKLQVEWRPMDDLLLRATVADVFRAPTIGNLFSGPQGNAPTASDPCFGFTNADTDPGHVAACGPGTGATNIPPGGITKQPNSQLTGVLSGSNYAGYTLRPEQGRSFDWGLVYDPSWLSGASVSLDYWRLKLDDNISSLGAQTVLTQCYQDANSPFCPYIHRTQLGQVDFIEQPTVNLGRLDASGWDLALRYKLPSTSWGSFSFGFDGTYIAKWDNDVDTTTNVDPVVHLAGHYNKDYGNYSRVRARLFADWSLGDFTVGWRTRYVGGFDLGSNDVRQQTSADGACASDPIYCYALHYGAYMVHSLQASYSLPSVNSRVEVGVDNLTDKQPPMMFQNNVLNANTDVNTFDTIGRYFWARYTVKF